jgi:hypothetical protein
VAVNRWGAPVFCAMLDVGPAFLYIIHRTPINDYALTLLAKLVLIIMMRLPAAQLLVRVWPFLLYLCGVALLGLGFLGAPTQDCLQLIGFSLQIGLTIAIVHPEQMRVYLAVYGYALLANFLIYLDYVAREKIPLFGDRYYYFSGFHYNLGAEIGATGLACAAAVLDGRVFFVAWAVETISIYLMQGRSALLLSVGLAGLMLFRLTSSLALKYRFALWGGVSAASAMAILLSQRLFAAGIDFVSTVFLLNDPYRGTASGFSGRTQGWQAAIAEILQHPFVGGGAGYFGRWHLPPPHNLVLFLGAQFGVLCLPMLGLIVYKYACLYRLNRRLFYIWLQFLPLLLFNDRSFNLNPYPYVLYCVLFSV